ncbi:MAG: VWA domain-containing protein [Thermoguttaceae bacterium]|nr:VWA domain-containing protein [Thermoguttaceae bacterium]MBQ6828875.1 VWA domain-containing protein [Thermoguttaceae bacterium]
MSRRLPIYILVDGSGSMYGKAIQAVQNGLDTLQETLLQDPYALGSAWISIISYGVKGEKLVPLTELDQLVIPPLSAPKSSAANLGAGLETLLEQYDKEVVIGSKDRKGDWLPILVVMTDGAPTDVGDYHEAAAQIVVRSNTTKTPPPPGKKQYRFGRVIICAAEINNKDDKAKRYEELRRLSDEIVELERMDGPSFAAFCQFVSDSISYSSQSPTRDATELPSPPPGMIYHR